MDKVMLIGGLDVGTTGCKLTIYNSKGEYICNEYVEYDVSRKNGEHEVNAGEIYKAVCKVICGGHKRCGKISAIGVTTFGETFVLLDEDDNVLAPSMLYTDPRGQEECVQLSDKLGEEKIIKITGVKPHCMYSLPKIAYIKNNEPEIYSKVKRILLIEDFIVYMLTGKAQIDYSLAARTLGFDIRNKCWSEVIFAVAGIDVSLMSQPVKTGTCAGRIKSEIANELGASENMLIVSGCHDQVAAAVGAGVFSVGDAVDGTGTVECFTPVFDAIPENSQLYNQGYSVVPYVFDNTYVCYALSFTGGAVLKWFRDNFARYEKMIAEENGENAYANLDKMIPTQPTDILVLPHFAGAANPYMDNGSKGVVIGLTLEHTNIDFYKALMEGVTYEIMTNIEHLNAFGIKPERIIATGGGASSAAWLQIKADILNRRIISLSAKEAGACGTCMLTVVAIGLYNSLHDAKRVFVKEKEEYTPDAERGEIYKNNYSAYKKIYSAVRPIIGGNTKC